MKHIKSIIAIMALAGATAGVMAQDGTDSNTRQRPRPPMPPLIAALDANHDGVIDATEIDNASAALRKLDKNGDGKLTQDELRPPRPGGGRGPDGERGPRNGQRPPHDRGQDGPPADDQFQN